MLSRIVNRVIKAEKKEKYQNYSKEELQLYAQVYAELKTSVEELQKWHKHCDNILHKYQDLPDIKLFVSEDWGRDNGFVRHRYIELYNCIRSLMGVFERKSRSHNYHYSDYKEQNREFKRNNWESIKQMLIEREDDRNR